MWRSTEFGLIICRGDIVTIKKEVKHAVRDVSNLAFILEMCIRDSRSGGAPV